MFSQLLNNRQQSLLASTPATFANKSVCGNKMVTWNPEHISNFIGRGYQDTKGFLGDKRF